MGFESAVDRDTSLDTDNHPISVSPRKVLKPYYEMHITMLGSKDILAPMVKKMGWKFSAIDGDPVLGDGIKCYATAWLSPRRISQDEAVLTLTGTADILKHWGANVIREKIELVIYDTRKGRCNGACQECVS